MPKNRPIQNILVVDDNRIAAHALADFLSRDGYEVELAYDGESAVNMANAFDPDAIILDIDLPRKNGYEVARTLRQSNSSALLIALTGYYGKREDKFLAEVVGFDYHLTRPVLVAEIEKLLNP